MADRGTAEHRPPDGRTARRDRNRSAVLDAAIELFAEGCLLPTAPQVAERSGVSLRSVFRYFEDTDELIRSAIAHQRARLRPLVALPAVGEGPLEDRIDRFVEQRVLLYESGAPVARAGAALRSRSPLIAQRIDGAREELLAQARAHFAPELDGLDPGRRTTTEALLHAVTQFDAFELWRTHLGLPLDAVATAMRSGIAGVLGGTGPVGTGPG